MSVRKGAPQFSSLLDKCVLWYTGEHSAVTNTAKIITANGNATQSTAVLDPWGEPRPVGYFDGNGDWLTTPDIDYWGNFVDFDFTIECRFRLTSGFQPNICGQYVDTNNFWGFYVSANSRLYFLGKVGGVDKFGYYVPVTFTTNTWYHVAVIKNGSNWYMSINGTLTGCTIATTYSGAVNIAAELTIGATYGGGSRHRGYLSEVRFSNIARYTSDFTPPTTRFKPDVNTKLLLHMYGSGNTFVDDPFIDVNEFPVLPSGVTVTPNGMFTKTDLGNNKSVVKFDGSTNYVTVGTVSTFNFLHQVGTSGKWSITAWIKCNGFTTNQRIITTSRGSTSNHGFTLSISNTTRIIYVEIVYGSSGNYIVGSSGSNIFPNDSDWHYLILTYDQSLSSTNCNIYLDGTLNGTASKTANTPSTSDASYAATIGGQPTTNILNGNMKDLMIWNDRVLTLPEIKLLMNRTHPIMGAGLLPGGYDYYLDV